MRLIENTCALLSIILLLVCGRDSANSNPVGTGGPSVVTEGKDALLTCVIMGLFENDTVIWRRGSNEILAAGTNRVTQDRRISVLHDEPLKGRSPSGGDVWVLAIKSTRPSDTDLYVCEVNSDPPFKSFHPLKVKALNATTKGVPTINATSDGDDNKTYVHDFTDCCQSLNVSTKCLGFCAVHNIVDGTTGIEPDSCEADFPRIVKCMADGRNHLPCCERKKIPDLCQDMCEGEYTPFTNYVRSRVSCVAYTLPALKCILEGVQKIPSAPEEITVEPLNESSLQVSWSPPARLADKVTTYSINVTMLHSFDEDVVANISSDVSVTVSADSDSAIIKDLKPFTMYSISMTANNNFGSSLPSVRIRALTLDSGVVGTRTSVAVVPVLPDIRSCCIKNGMTHHTCVDKMCDPRKTDQTEITDLMVCAPWANITYSCLANKIDHTPCCLARGIPKTCLPFCSGNVTTITFSLFRCLQYMSDYSSCLLQGYGVLAGAPSRVKAPLISDRFAIVEWNPPKILPETVTSYNVHVRKLNSDDEYVVIEKDHPPIIIEGLDSGSFYETFVVAVNSHGKGAPSSRLVFPTKRHIETSVEAGELTPSYNITSCCKASGIMPQCMPLCTYDLKVSDLQLLGQTCSLQMGALAKCAAGGRDHTPCCNRRGVIPSCLSLCRGIVPQPPVDCLSYGGNIIQCFEEGTGNIPGPVENLHATLITKTSISLAWEANQEDANNTRIASDADNQKKTNIDYIVQYGKVNNMTMYETVVKLENEINTTDTEIDLTNLESNALYRILVYARGVHGTSLPSSMLLINTTEKAMTPKDSPLYGVPSPPHSLAISARTATWVTVSWQPPEYSHLHESMKYQIFHKATADNETFSIIETRLLWARINNLKPNSQHVVYVVAIGAKGESLPSETLVAWTDPALPAFVDPPTIHPNDVIAEGGSMTILCLALGNPIPTISLYVGGHFVRSEIARHMVTIIQNVTKDMDKVSCQVSNGYGVPMQATRKISISFAPRIQPSGITLALLGERVELKCVVKAKPQPQVIFWRDHEGKEPVPLGANYEMTTDINSDDVTQTIMTLAILRLTNEYVGDYFCHAENKLGSSTRAVSVRIRNTPAAHNISECCVAQNVSSACMDACSFYIDIDAVKDRPECLFDFDKLMKCASDGSDHRACCAKSDVPRYCLNWCRGEPLALGSVKGPSCVLEHTKSIVDCFQSNRDRLPSPPLNLAVLVVSDTEALIKWDAPMKNPHMVEGYRIYWHEVEPVTDDPVSKINNIGTYRVDTKDMSVRIGDLRPNIVYELVVKAGNKFGSSVLTDPIRFQLGDQHITSTSDSGATGTFLGIFAGIIAILLAIAAVLFYKHRNSIKGLGDGGVSFENPSYLREVNMENVQISALSNNDSGMNWRMDPLSSNSANVSANGTVSSELQMNSAAAVPDATEVNPSLYDEIKLGHKGSGFKRLVS